MGFIYTEHAEEKLQRKDIREFGINKKLLEFTITTPDYEVRKTSTGEFAAVSNLKEVYILGVVYDKIGVRAKIITFHIARRGRYGTKIL